MKTQAARFPAVFLLTLAAWVFGFVGLRGQDVPWSRVAAPMTNWQSVAISADGRKMIAVVRNGGIWVSTNWGVTWAEAGAPATNWQSVVSSADGIRLAAPVYGGGIYTSVNSGASWPMTSAPVTNWQAVGSSADGVRLVAVVDGGEIYSSSDSGVNWAPTTAPVQNWASVTSSSEGGKLAAAVNGGGIYISGNSGTNWTKTSAPNGSWCSIASSAEGTKLVAAMYGGGIHRSTNSGVSWTLTDAAVANWQSVASSADGTGLVAAIQGGGIYCSTNGGLRWQQAAAPDRNWACVAASSEGLKHVAVASSGGIYSDIMPSVTQQPAGAVLCPGGAYAFAISVAGLPPLGLQWRKSGTNLVDGGNVSGSTTTNLNLVTLSLSDTGDYDIVVTNPYASVTSSVAVLSVAPVPARASPIVYNGFIIGAVLLDGGCGYTSPPAIFFGGQGGSSAVAYAEISEGVVTNLWIASAGYGYPTNAVLVVAPPIYPVMDLIRTRVDPPGATATPVVTNGFVVGANLTAGGRDYSQPPGVSFEDVTGHGAAAYTKITNGAVVSVVVTNAGSGYSSNTVLTIAAPPTVTAVIPRALDLMVGQTYQLKTANTLTNWRSAGAAFVATNAVWVPSDYWNVASTNSVFFRVQLSP